MKALAEADKYELHLLDLFLPIKSYTKKSLACEPSNIAVFNDGGFAAIHSDIYSENDIAILARASRFSHDSHRHADQGSFAIFAGKAALISPSGYFGAGYGTKHHLGWMKKTKAHNTLIIGGCDQMQVEPTESVGKIVDYSEKEKNVTLDLSSAYPNIKSFIRKITLKDNIVSIRDIIDSDSEVDILYPLHTLSEPKECGNDTIVERMGARLTITPLSGNLTLNSISDRFDIDLNEGIADEFKVEMPKQYHIYYKAPEAKHHDITVEYRIEI